MSRRTVWVKRHALDLALLGTIVLFLASGKDCTAPQCSSAKCPGDSLGIYLEGACWCITKPEP